VAGTASELATEGEAAVSSGTDKIADVSIWLAVLAAVGAVNAVAL
jgi:hypothetical protein